MSTAPTTLELAISASKLEPENALAVTGEFHPFFALATEWATKVAGVTDATVARDSRLALKKIRCDAKNVHKRLKAEVISYGNAIDGCFNVIAGVTEPLEAHLLGIEQAAELAEKARRNELRRVRGEALRPYLPAVELSGLDEMAEDQFQKLLDSVKTAREAQIEKDKQAEAARALQAEKDRLFAENLKRVQAEETARIAAENAKLKAEREKMEADAAVERQRIAAEHAKLEAERQKAERETERLRREGAARKLEEDNRIANEKKIAEARAAEEKRQAERAAAAPDREKLLALVAWLENVPNPGVTSALGVAAAERICDEIGDLITFIKQEANNL